MSINIRRFVSSALAVGAVATIAVFGPGITGPASGSTPPSPLQAQSQRDYPVHIEGHRSTGWDITWDDGHHTGLGPWKDLVEECRQDGTAFFACWSTWNQYEWDLGTMRAILKHS